VIVEVDHDKTITEKTLGERGGGGMTWSILKRAMEVKRGVPRKNGERGDNKQHVRGKEKIRIERFGDQGLPAFFGKWAEGQKKLPAKTGQKLGGGRATNWAPV